MKIKLTPEEASSPMVQAIIRQWELSIYAVWNAVLVGNQCEKVRWIYEDMQHPGPGDLVIEVSSLFREWMRGEDGKLEPRGICGIGYLVGVADEPAFTPDEWTDPTPIPTHKVWTILLLDGRKFRWTNALFLKVHNPLDK